MDQTVSLDVMNYDPNLISCGRMAKQTVRLTFAVWDYRLTEEVTVGGNCTGFTVIDCAVGTVYNQLAQRSTYSSDETYAAIYLKHSETGEVLECEDDDDRCEDWLKDMLISAEIINIQPDPSF